MILSLRQKLTPAVSKQTALDLVERAAVVFLFVFFAVRMLPRLAQLIQLQMTHPELIVAAAGISALLLAVSEDAPVGRPGRSKLEAVHDRSPYSYGDLLYSRPARTAPFGSIRTNPSFYP